MKHAYLVAFVLASGMITWQSIKNCHALPFPKRIIDAGIVFALLDFLGILSEELAGTLALGFVLALVMNTIAPPNKFKPPIGKSFFCNTSDPLGGCCDFLQKGTVHTSSYQVFGNEMPGTTTA